MKLKKPGVISAAESNGGKRQTKVECMAKLCKAPAEYRCDSTTSRETLSFAVCGARMCGAHVGSNPGGEDYHRCIPCAAKRGERPVGQ